MEGGTTTDYKEDLLVKDYGDYQPIKPSQKEKIEE
jgi:hypothetical protein